MDSGGGVGREDEQGRVAGEAEDDEGEGDDEQHGQPGAAEAEKEEARAPQAMPRGDRST